MPDELIIYSSLFPSPKQPVKGLFVSELAKALADHADVRVIKPRLLNQAKINEWKEDGYYLFEEKIPVTAPLCINIPKVLKSTDAFLMALCTKGALKKNVSRNTKLIHAHFAYPEAVAAWHLALEMKLPFVVTIHGSDINVLARDEHRKTQIVKMLNQADAIIGVSAELVQKIIDLGITHQRIFHIPNGVNTSKFCPGDKIEARKKIGAGHLQKLLLTVGNLVPIKGYDRLIQALPVLPPDIGLVMAGTGHEKNKLERLSRDLKVRDRIIFAGAIEHDKLMSYYQAADFLMISSHSEGWPTVIFEAFSCGLPVIANNVGGIREAIFSHRLGVLMENNLPETITQSVLHAFNINWNPEDVMSVAMQHSWAEIAKQTLAVYYSAINFFKR